jgi:hypothetical protein
MSIYDFFSEKWLGKQQVDSPYTRELSLLNKETGRSKLTSTA